jgi:hypothetical protein
MTIRVVLFDIGGVLETETAMPAHLFEAFEGRDPEDLLTIGVRSEEWIRTALRTQVGLPDEIVERYMADLWTGTEEPSMRRCSRGHAAFVRTIEWRS